MINGRDTDTIPTTTPTTPQIIESLAALNLLGSPCEVKNINAETRNIIIASPMNTGQIRFNILTITIQKSDTDNGKPGGVVGLN